MSAAAVHLEHVSKRFRLGGAHDSLRDLLSAGMDRLLGRRSKGRSTFWALRDVDFRVGQGESLGIIGPNGAGKSTALKLLAGILRPDEGAVNVSGRLAALIEVGAGFHGDLTGRENVFLNGAILGMSRIEIREKMDRIVDFAGIGAFLDEPVKRYSSGMYARLGFSIAAHVDPDVLLVDEVLSVGDAVFRVRCLDRMRELVATGTTLVFVTHNLEQVQTICPRTVVLEQGRCAFDGPSVDAISHYMKAVSRSSPVRQGDLAGQPSDGETAVELTSLRCRSSEGAEVLQIKSGDSVAAEMQFTLRRPVPRLAVELNLRAATAENVLSFNSERDGRAIDGTVGAHSISAFIPRVPLAGGQYFWNVKMWDGECGKCLLNTPMSFPLMIDDGGRTTGRLALDHEWVQAGESTASNKGRSTMAEANEPADTSAKGREHEDLLLR